MNRPLSRILALVLLAGVVYFVARPYVGGEEPAAGTPPLRGLVSAEARTVLERPGVERLLVARDQRVALTRLGSATVQHELRFNDYDFAWLDEDDDVRTVLAERPDARRFADVTPPGFVALTSRGEGFGTSLAQDPALRRAVAGDAPRPRPTPETEDHRPKAADR